jgi:hypothetical protein
VLHHFQLVLYRQKVTSNPKLVLQLRDADIKADLKKDTKFTIAGASHKNAAHDVRDS